MKSYTALFAFAFLVLSLMASPLLVAQDQPQSQQRPQAQSNAQGQAQSGNQAQSRSGEQASERAERPAEQPARSSDVGDEAAADPQREARDEQQETMPATASNIPMLALYGIASLGAALALRKRSR